MLNLHAAWLVCKQLGMEAQAFLDGIAGFTGAGMRMETLISREDLVLIRDYAHAPAKVEATVEAARERYAKHSLIACMELHTFSSLSREYLPMYKGTMRQADRRLVFVDPHAVEQKRMQPLTASELRAAFGDPGLVCAFSPDEVLQFVRQSRTQRDVLLMMSSGSFGGLDFQALAQ
jgi:UDP-N-acetylmuramate: L-alanyl-gamma-D-glutamyl-meso-diaminopimelate ligase